MIKSWNFVYIPCPWKIFQNTLNSICTTIRVLVFRMSAQSDVVYWSYRPKPSPTPPASQKIKKMGPMGSWTKKNVVLLLGKFVNDKCTESETWHSERVEEFPIVDYVRSSNNRLARSQWGNLDSVWVKKMSFYLILQECCDFSGTWDLRYLTILRI